MPVPNLSNHLKKSQWETHRGILAKVASKVVSTHANMSKMLGDIESSHTMLGDAVAKAQRQEFTTKQVESVAKMLADKLNDVVADCEKLRGALEKPLLKMATKQSQDYLKNMQTAAKTLEVAVKNTNALLA